MCRSWHHILVMGAAVLVLCGGTRLAAQQPSDPDKTESGPPAAGRPPEGDVGQLQGEAAQASSTEAVEPLGLARPPAPLRSARAGPASAVVREPSQGRPIFITPNETFYFVMRLPPDLRGDVSFALRHSLEPGIRVALRPATPPSYVNDEYCSLVLLVPATTKPGLYDVEVRSKTHAYYSRRSVKVVDTFKTKFRFVHLSNMNVGDLTAPDFDEMLPREINLLAPEFIIATGDYTEWARVRDDASSWHRVLRFFEKFNAPVFMLCGLNDHEASFTRFVASKPIGTLDYGSYHGLLLLDHPGNPIEQDYAQLQWIETDLRHSRNKRFNFIAANSHELALLDIWRERGGIEDFIREHKIKMFITGGSTDWDRKEFAGKLAGLDDFHLIRTHQASTSLRDQATGSSHYRVIEVDGGQVSYVYPDDNASENRQHSIPTGRLRAYYDAPNDGSVGRVAVTVQNALNQGFEDAHVWLRVAKGGGGSASAQKPEVAPGRVVQVFDAGDHWAIDVAFDLPDKGAVRILASSVSDDVPPALPIAVELAGPTEWAFAPQTTDFGLSFFSSDAPVSIKFTNQARTALTCWPVIRVNGGQLHADRSACPRLPLTLEPGKSVSVPLVLNLRRVSPGEHALQIHFLEDPLSRLHTFQVTLAHQE